jgi:AraC-like DNA-binding protein
MVSRDRVGVLGKIAADLDRALRERSASGASGRPVARVLDRGDGWSVSDVVCTSGPGDRSFEEQHSGVSISVVVGGTFQYRSARGHHLMTPGSLLLGNASEYFECGHDHGAGDRCVAFRYAPESFEQLIADSNTRHGNGKFKSSRLPPSQGSSALVARAASAISRMTDLSWEEIALELAVTAIRFDDDHAPGEVHQSAASVARVTEGVRAIQRSPAARLTLAQLARDAGQSPFQYLRTFRRLTGVTPHQFILRTRLRDAASRLLAHDTNIIDVALDSGFGDLSNFNRAFRLEFGLTPRAYRRRFARRA